MRISIADSLQGIGIQMGAAVAVSVDNRRNVDLSAEWGKAANVGDSARDLLSDVIIRAYRDFYWRFLKIDPTKQRPAQEALIRRILNNGKVPSINPAVDIGNIVSIKYKVPIGLYDMDKIRADKLILRYAAEGEVFVPIGSPRRTLNGNQIVLATNDGVIMHVYPYRDSELTMVEPNTRNILIISAGVPGVTSDLLIRAAEEVGLLYERYLGGKLIRIELVEGRKEVDVSPGEPQG